MNRLTKRKRFAAFLCLLLALTACDLGSGPGTNLESPTVTKVSPTSGAADVPLSMSVTVTLDLVNGGNIDRATLTSDTVRLVDPNGTQVPAAVSATANDTVTLEPDSQLAPNTRYRFEVTNGVKDSRGASVEPYTSTFTTGTKDSAVQPTVESSDPANGATDVFRDAAVKTNLNLTGSGVDPATLTSANVRLTNLKTGIQVAASLGTSGGNDVVTLSPRDLLEPNTEYRFEITSGLKNLDGVSFVPYTSTFKTGTKIGAVTTVAFTPTTVVTGTDKHTSLVIGPDNKLYATTVDGRIKRFTIQADGTLGTPQVISSLQQAEGGARLLIGFAFDPNATANNLVAWVSHTYAGFDDLNNYQPWSGKITRLSGPNLENVQDFVVGLPRSTKDHVTNSVAFGPDGALYFNQGANNAMGAPDSTWQWQAERLLNAAVLRLDISKVTSPPVNVKTEEGGTYNPFAANAPLTIYGRGVRNAYDLVWHSNGQLYAPANGSAAGGNVPRFDPNFYQLPSGACETRPEGGYTGPRLTATDAVDAEYLGPPAQSKTDGWKITDTQHDFLFRVVKDGYYGHPNPKRCEWILNGGNPTANADPAEVVYEVGPSNAKVKKGYKVGTQPDPNYKGFSFDFGTSKSPNGAIEYESNTFGGQLKGKLLVVQYSTGNNILVLTPGSPSQNYDIIDNPLDTPSLRDAGTSKSLQFIDPLDLVENTATGDIYVSDFDEEGTNPKIVLLRPAN